MKVLLLLILLAASQANAGWQTEAVKVAESYSYVREKTGRNDGPEVEAFLRAVVLPKGNPWCMAFVKFDSRQAAKALDIKDPLPATGSVAIFAKLAKKNPYDYRWIPAHQLLMGEPVKPGDMLVWANGPADKSGYFKGHIGYIRYAGYPFHTIEGNTASGEAGSQRDGDGVYLRIRKIQPDARFRIIGVIRYKG